MIKRRTFLSQAGTGVTAAAAFQILPSGPALAASERLSIAFIGMGGRMQALLRDLLSLGHHAAAFCDVDQRQIDQSLQRHDAALTEKPKLYSDYRKLIEDGDFDAAVVSTPDHWHFAITKALMKAGKHVYCEKPLTHTVSEARQLRELARTSDVVTQTGNQGSASANLRRSMELIEADVFGPIREVHIWLPGHSWPSGVDRPEGEDAIPEELDWDFWCGPAPFRPYKESIYHPGSWRGWYDFGGGHLSDFCCHSFNLPLRSLHLDYPEQIRVRGTEMGKETFAKTCTISYDFPANDHRDHGVELAFYTGGEPDIPPDSAVAEIKKTFSDGEKLPRDGVVLIGEKGQLSVGLWNSRCYLQMDGEERFMDAGKHEVAKTVPVSLPRVQSHLKEWADACRGEGETFSNFDFGGHLTEIGLAGIVALRLQKDIRWDGEKMQVEGMPEADALISPTKRDDWL